MRNPSFTQRPLSLMMGLAMLAYAALPVHAQSVVNTNRSVAQPQVTVVKGGLESTDAETRARLKKALPIFWASTQPGKTYMILTTLVSRSADGNVTSIEQKGPYTFGPQTPSDLVATNAPDFVALLLGQYAAQSRKALAELEAGLASYFDSTRSSQGSRIPGGQLMRNMDGSATFTDGSIIFVFDGSTSALTVATMAPVLAAGLADFAASIAIGEPSGGYALRDPSNASRLINFDGRVYDTAGNALERASPAVVSALFGSGNGSRNNMNSGSIGSTSGASNSDNSIASLGSSATVNSGSDGSTSNSSTSNSSTSDGSTINNSTSNNSTSNNSTSNGSTRRGSAVLSTGSATGIASSRPSSSLNSDVCHATRVLGVGGSLTCN